MSKRTFAVGDIHGDLDALERLLERLPRLGTNDTLVFLGDYVDRGPASADVVVRVRELQAHCPATVVALRGNHEDAWLRVVDEGWPNFILPRGNGCLETLRSFAGKPQPAVDETADEDEFAALLRGTFFPVDVVEWMRALPFFFEDEHALYVHAGLMRKDGAFPHPSQVTPSSLLLWVRDRDFFATYDGKLVVFGHTVTSDLPAELSSFTPDDPDDLWAGKACAGLDTGAGKGGYLTALELPNRYVYTSKIG